MTEQLIPITPGEIVLHEFMEPLGMTQTELADALNIPLSCVREIIHGNRAISSDIALRLARYFGTSPEFWLNLQQRYDLKVTQRLLGAQIEQTVQPRNTSAT